LLKGGDRSARAALQFLKTAPIEEGRRAEVERALEGILDGQTSLTNDALQALRRWGPKTALDRLAKRLHDTSPGAAAFAIEELSQIDDDRAAELLVGQLKAGEFRTEAVRHLPRLGKRAEKYVLPLYNDPEFFVRSAARKVIKQLGTSDEDVVKQTVDDVESPQQERRLAALDMLAGHKPTSKELQERAGKVLGEVLTTSKDTPLRNKAVDALEKWATKDSVPGLLTVLGDLGKTQQALGILAKIKDERMIRPLALRLNSPERVTIAKILAGYGEAAEEEVWIQLRNLNQRTRLDAVEILSVIGTQKSIKPLQTYRQLYKAEARVANEAIKEIQKREKAK
jgi:HEAT repeat protein